MTLALRTAPIILILIVAIMLGSMLILVFVFAPVMMTITMADSIVMMFVLMSVESAFVCPPTLFAVLFALFRIPGGTPNKHNVE
jgi:hypothetical protein